MENEFKSIGLKNQRKNLRTLPQTAKGKTDKIIDAYEKSISSWKKDF